MQQEGYLLALAGLLSDPIFHDEIDKIVPKRWLNDTLKAMKADRVIRAVQMAGGLAKDINPRLDSGVIKERLISVFSMLASEGRKADHSIYLPPVPLELKRKSIFPGAEKDLGEIWKSTWDEFLKEAAILRLAYEETGAQTDFVENILFLMQRYLWSAPSRYTSLSGISLYDHSRITAALAFLNADDAMLVAGDISGIQKFIYTITSKKAAQALRGRSFYLQLLTEAVLRFVLHEMGLLYTNAVYSGGGHFFLLAPASEKDKLAKIRRDITKKLLSHHVTDEAKSFSRRKNQIIPMNGIETKIEELLCGEPKQVRIK